MVMLRGSMLKKTNMQQHRPEKTLHQKVENIIFEISFTSKSPLK